MTTKLKRYTIKCPAVLSYVSISKNKKDALRDAKEEFYGLLRFLSKSSEGAQVIGGGIEDETIISEISDEV